MPTNQCPAIPVLYLLPAILFFLILAPARATHAHGDTGPGKMRNAQVSKECRKCHDQIWNEWENSPHAKAYTSQSYHDAAAQEPDRTNRCDTCHSPEPILTGGVGSLPKARSTNQESGVDCISCHMDVEGAMHGPFQSQSQFHRTVREEKYKTSPDVCISCHGQSTEPNYDQFSAFKLAALMSTDPLTCQTCHMPTIARKAVAPTVTGTPVRKTGHHGILGPSNPELLKLTAKLILSATGNTVTIEVVNRAGHMLPGGGWREVVLELFLVDAAGKEEPEPCFKYSFARQLNGVKDTRIAGFQSKKLTAILPRKSAKVRARLWFKPLASAPDSQRQLMTTEDLAL